MADEETIATDVMATPEQVLAAGGVSKRRRGTSSTKRRSPSGQRFRAPTPEPPKDLQIDPDEEIDLKSEMLQTKISPVKRVTTTEKTLITKRSHSSPGEDRQRLPSSPISEQIAPKLTEYGELIGKVLDPSPTSTSTVQRKSTAEKTLVFKRSQSTPGEERQRLPSSTSTDVSVKPAEEQHKEVSPSKTMVIKRRSTTEKSLITKRSQSSPGEGRISLSSNTDDSTDGIMTVPRRRKSDEGEKIIKISSELSTKKSATDSTEQSVNNIKESIKSKISTETVQTNKPKENIITESVEKIEIKSPISVSADNQEKKSIHIKEAVEDVKDSKIIKLLQTKEIEDTTKTIEVSVKEKTEIITTAMDVSTEKEEIIATDESSVPPAGVLEKPVREAVWGPFFREMRAEWKKFVNEHSDQWGKILTQRNRCIGALLVMIIYCGFGGLIFRFTEGAFEAFYKCGVKRVKRDFVDSLWLGSHNLLEEEWKSQARKKLMELETQLHAAHEAGVTSYSGQRAWNFLNAVVYCLTVITTIGYGHISPSTTTGRAITIVYAIFGIPMFLILLADFGKLFTRGIKFIWAFVRRVYYTGSCKKVRRTVPVQEVMKGVQLVYDFATFRRPSQMVGEVGENAKKAPIAHPEDLELQVPLNQPQASPSAPINIPLDGHEPPGTPALSTYEVDDEFNLPISVAIVILLIYIFVGAIIYWTWETWGFFESFYFVFISMSTIGFGDFVPQHPMYMMASIVYLVFGLALTSMCINVVQEKLSDSFRQASAKIGATIGLQVNEEDGSITPVPPVQIELPEVHNTNTITKSQST